ncbi:hypothetical protein [Grimontia hollisae]|uniref:hypothetical protein n=1 Tax=Grimontia hollisae TaxID=673 RepID=UPI00165DA9D1|nr:hypothetical protein [Grimontia hollisae]
MNTPNEHMKIQDAIFSAVAEKHSHNFEKSVTMFAAGDRETDDILALVDKKLLKWQFNLKANAATTAASNPEHMINSVVYYGEPVNGFACMGYAIGCVSKDGTAIEINFMEKRVDSGTEWCQQFLPLIVDAYAAYALYLNTIGSTNIDKLVFVGPVEGAKHYYTNKGLVYVPDYNHSEAMIAHLDK